tara:strand:+ start:7470 stop:8459 length:990 start_codon:yes stop_codon:yes gene_type:complete
MKHLILFTALGISFIAAYYSIVGLAAIFAASVIPVIVMGTSLEIGKLVSVAYLHQKWNTVPLLLKGYFIFAIFLLMFITSMGIFGFLSKAHIEQTVVSGDNTIKIERIDSQIKRQNRVIKDAETVLYQLDKAVQVLIDFDRIRGDTGAIAQREKQKLERNQLSTVINSAENTIDKLQIDKLSLEKEQIQLEAEVGPIKYIAEFVYGEKANRSMLEESVKWVIILIVIVFDPLAVCLLIAWSHLSISNPKKEFVNANANTKKKVLFEVPKEVQVKVDEKRNKTIIIAGKEYTEPQIAGILKSNFNDLPDDQKTVYNKFRKKKSGGKSGSA